MEKKKESISDLLVTAKQQTYIVELTNLVPLGKRKKEYLEDFV